ncbi:hypothetical protein XENOCAPTIV_008443, partial [Xenoophorus captivus]
ADENADIGGTLEDEDESSDDPNLQEEQNGAVYEELGIMLSTTGQLLFIHVSMKRLAGCCWIKRSSTTSQHRYLRYLRFFPDGCVLMLTTPEDPLSVVPRLRTRNTRCSSVNYKLKNTRPCNIKRE